MKNKFSKIKFYLTHPIVKFYVRHPIILLKNRFYILWLKIKKILRKDINFFDNISSRTKIDVVIPAIDKDYDVLIYAIDSIKRYIKHPIGNIIIISPESDKIKKICKEKKCRFVDEDTVLPITKKDIKYNVNGIDRSGWLFQQLLKWDADQYCSQKYFLITDADTIFIRPRIFEYHNKIIFPCNNCLCHIPYFKTYKKLLNKEIKPILYLTSHHALYDKEKLNKLKKSIKNNCKTAWYKAIINNIDNREGSFISDYEIYGQFVLSNYRQEILLEHWFNKRLSKKELKNLKELENKFFSKYKALSFQSYDS